MTAWTVTAPGSTGTDADLRLRARLDRALAAVDAPDVVLAVSRGGRRTTVGAGTGVPDLGAARKPAHSADRARSVPREALRYELGSLSKTFTVLLLAELARAGFLGLDDPLAAHLPAVPLPHPYARRMTLRHLATHTSGLPRVPHDLMAAALLRPYGNGYADYDTDRLLRAFARTRTRHAPGTHWHYSNFGLALLGPAMEHATSTDYATLLAERVLRPLGLNTTGTSAGTTGNTPEGTDSIGYRSNGRTPLPPTDMAGFAPAGAVRATPADLLTYAEALLSVASAGSAESPDITFPEPERASSEHPGTPSPTATSLTAALRDVQVPQLRRGFGRRHTHTLTWYQHPGAGGPLLFHAGATFGHQAFLGFHPATGTAVAAVSTRHDRTCRLVTSAYDLLHDLCGPGAAAPRSAPGSATPS